MILLVLVNILYTILFVYLGYFFYRADVKQRNNDNYLTLVGYSIVFLPIYIVINSKLKDPKQIQEVIDHETEHIFQMRDGRENSKYGEGRGRLDYDNENVYWEGKTIPRSSIEEGAKDLPWEKEAYNNTKK